MATTLWTVGYESCEIDEFVLGLKKKRIQLIADVRKNPVSRKPGFAKSRLAAKLSEAGIEYLHMPNLGVPTEWRKMAKAEIITRAKMFKDYQKKILPTASEDISLLKSLMKKSRVAVLCYEANADDCHRKFVAEKVAPKTKIINLDMLTNRERIARAR